MLLNKTRIIKPDYSYFNLEKENNFVDEKEVQEGYQLAETINFNMFIARTIFHLEYDAFSSGDEKESFELWKIFKENQCLNMLAYGLICS